jgi:hypothetical protein
MVEKSTECMFTFIRVPLNVQTEPMLGFCWLLLEVVTAARVRRDRRKTNGVDIIENGTF